MARKAAHHCCAGPALANGARSGSASGTRSAIRNGIRLRTLESTDDLCRKPFDPTLTAAICYPTRVGEHAELGEDAGGWPPAPPCAARLRAVRDGDGYCGLRCDQDEPTRPVAGEAASVGGGSIGGRRE